MGSTGTIECAIDPHTDICGAALSSSALDLVIDTWALNSADAAELDLTKMQVELRLHLLSANSLGRVTLEATSSS